MPIYEYRCGACGHHLEVLQKMSEGALRKCPECGKSQLRRLVSAPQFRLKGSGWYETDFKGDKEKKRNLVDSAGGGESSESGASGDSAAKTEADKSVAAAKGDGAKSDGGKSAKPKPVRTKTAAKKPAKTRATKSARA